MSKGNPMCIKYYSYKVEFTLRGAAHIHGVLWIDWKKFGSMEKKKTVYVIKAFEKIRNETNLSPENIQCLSEFADNFITCSLRDAETFKIVREVKIHHHTHTCRKYSTKCRFFFLRYPSVRTIIADLNTKLNESKENQVILMEK